MWKSSSPWLAKLLAVAVTAGPATVRGDAAACSHELDAVQAVAGPGVVARCFIPSERRREGEVRLLTGEWGPRVQVMLYTKSLGRALREMRQSEGRNWPEGSAWHSESLRFLSALDVFRSHLRAAADSSGDEASATYNLVIEFTRDTEEPSVFMDEAVYSGSPEALIIAGRRRFQEVALSANYVVSNQFLMVQEAFGLSAPDTADLFDQASDDLTKD